MKLSRFERPANAHLIAAAPELLEFAEQIFNGLETGMIQHELARRRDDC